MTSDKFYFDGVAKKRVWQPTLGNKTKVMPGTENTIGRALALSILELRIADWLTEADKSDTKGLTPGMKLHLESAIEDEVRHDIALGHAKKVQGMTTTAMEEEALRFQSELESLPDHPLVITSTLERSIFFVILPMFRFLSEKAGNLVTVSTDISGDEAVHASLTTQICKDLNYSYSPQLNKLRKDIVGWLISDLKGMGKYGRKQLWIDSSDSLFERGVADQLSETKAYSMPAFFEVNNQNLPYYV